MTSHEFLILLRSFSVKVS